MGLVDSESDMSVQTGPCLDFLVDMLFGVGDPLKAVTDQSV